MLLDKRAKVDVKSRDGNNPLLMASFNGQLDMVKKLLEQVHLHVIYECVIRPLTNTYLRTPTSSKRVRISTLETRTAGPR